MTALRWTLYFSLGVIAWLLFDPLPPLFLWCVIFLMMGSMSFHTVLHQRDRTPDWKKQTCRFIFFLSIPLLFTFAGNRFAVWSVAEASSGQHWQPVLPQANGAIATEEYLLYKELRHGKITDPVKTKKGLKTLIGKGLKKLKEMDDGVKVLLIFLAIILLIVILILVWLLISLSNAAEGCAGGTSDDGCI